MNAYYLTIYFDDVASTYNIDDLHCEHTPLKPPPKPEIIIS